MIGANLAVFGVTETHGRVLRPENRVLAQSVNMGWRSLHAAILEEAPFQATEAAVAHPSLIYHLTRPTEVSRKLAGFPLEKTLIGPRRICLTPGGSVARWQHNGHPEILQMYLRQSIYESVFGEMYGCDPGTADMVPRFAITDPLLEQLAVAIHNALRDGTAQDGLYIDTLAQMIAVHLSRFHSTRSRPSRLATPDGISGWRMRRLIAYIEEHLEGDLSLEAMAAQVDVSPLYLARAFKVAIGQSPHQYVLSRRLERAKEMLRGSDLPIVEVALAAGFSSQSHLSNWFVRLLGVSPAAYRRQSAR